MLVLFDQSTPAPLRAYLKGHLVMEARDRGWDRLANGELLDAAERAGFEVFVTADKNLRYQQNLSERKIAVVVLGNGKWPVLRRHAARVALAVDRALSAATWKWTFLSSESRVARRPVRLPPGCPR